MIGIFSIRNGAACHKESHEETVFSKIVHPKRVERRVHIRHSEEQVSPHAIGNPRTRWPVIRKSSPSPRTLLSPTTALSEGSQKGARARLGVAVTHTHQALKRSAWMLKGDLKRPCLEVKYTEAKCLGVKIDLRGSAFQV